ncbi:MAG TPA: T9SS type A sorting domain-containing protein [Parafilimonas sp.]|nr:T9SS type A sorting domain-containing protein [Parafilimonas sp.]
MKTFSYFLLCFALFLLINNAKAQNAGIITNGTTTISTVITVSPSATLIIPGDVKLNGSSDSIINSGTVTIAGNFTNKGNSFSRYANGKEIFNGNSTILAGSGTKNSVFNNLMINNGAVLALNRSIDVTNDWTNYGHFAANTKQVSFSGTVASQNIYGSGTFYDLVIQNNTNFLASLDTIKDEFSNTAIMDGGTSLVVFDSVATIIRNYAKNFYDIEITSNGNVTHNSGNGNVHIAHGFTNNGVYTEGLTYTIFFDKSGGNENLYGSGTTVFGNLTVGDGSGLSFATTLNANSHNFSITGGSLTFKRSSVFNGNTCTVTFSTNNAVISGSGMANFNNVITNVDLDFGSGISTINKNLVINNGSLTPNAPTYCNTSSLIDNTTTLNYNTGFEWSSNNTSAGMGVPQNVSVTNSNSVILSGDRTIPGTLTLTAGSLGINDHTLTVVNGFAGTGGNLKGSVTSNLIAGGNGTIYFDALANYLKNFTVNNSANITLGNALNIAASDGGTTNSFGILTANGTLNANNFLTLKSDQYGDAIVGNGHGKINGNTTVERYIPAKRAWRFLTVPFSSSTQTINQAWQEGQWQISDPGCPAVDAAPYGYGTQITYDNLNGYDWNTTSNASLKVWTVNGWVPPSSTLTPHITDYPGYCLFVRGDRHICTDLGTGAGAGSTTLRATGIMNETGTDFIKNIAGVNDGDYLFIGNPFASPVNIPNALSHFTGINQNEFWVWDPSVGGTHGVGAFITYSNGIGVPQSGSNYSGGDNAQSGQAFFIRANASGTATLRFQQGDKITTEGKVFGKPISAEDYPAIYTNLMTSDGNSLVLVDGVGAAFDNSFAAKVDENDAGKFWNFDENIALLRNDYRLAIELRPFPFLADTFFYKLYLRPQPYVLQIFSKNFPNNTLHAWLIDKYLNTKLALNLNDTTLYGFTPSCANNECDTNSYRNRFMIVLSKNFIATPVPVTRVANQANPRISGITNSIAVQPDSVSVSPNPVIKGEKIMLHFLNVKHGHYEVAISNTLGKILTEKSLIHNGPTDTYFLQTDTRWAAGNYFVKITSESGNVFIAKLIISK